MQAIVRSALCLAVGVAGLGSSQVTLSSKNHPMCTQTFETYFWILHSDLARVGSVRMNPLQARVAAPAGGGSRVSVVRWVGGRGEREGMCVRAVEVRTSARGFIHFLFDHKTITKHASRLFSQDADG